MLQAQLLRNFSRSFKCFLREFSRNSPRIGKCVGFKFYVILSSDMVQLLKIFSRSFQNVFQENFQEYIQEICPASEYVLAYQQLIIVITIHHILPSVYMSFVQSGIFQNIFQENQKISQQSGNMLKLYPVISF